MEEAALKRKERLKALQQLKAGELDDVPPNKRLKEDSEKLMNDLIKRVQTVEAKAELISEGLKKKATEILTSQVDITKLAPRKVDWDLKRDLEKKLEKLNRRTKVKIAELIRIRVTSSNMNLNNAVHSLNGTEGEE